MIFRKVTKALVVIREFTFLRDTMSIVVKITVMESLLSE